VIFPSFNQEKELYQEGYEAVAGVDEAGRGPLAGPVVAAAVVFSPEILNPKLEEKGIRDSKDLSGKRREELYKFIVQNVQTWGVGIVSEKVIDEINILRASILAMKEAVKNLKDNPDFLLIDGCHTISDYPVSQVAVPHGDKTIISISAASIIAKVTRDRMMLNFHQKFPQYGFDRHKGYGTRLHLEKIEKYGPCKIHRRSFNPIKEIIEKTRRKTC